MGTNNAKKPRKWVMAAYAVATVLLVAAAVFAKHLAVLFEGPILCIYIAVMPKYIFGLTAFLTALEGAVYASDLLDEPMAYRISAEGMQVLAVAAFLLFVFPAALAEGIPRGGTYGLLNLIIAFMGMVFLWDFIKDIIRYKKRR